MLGLAACQSSGAMSDEDLLTHEFNGWAPVGDPKIDVAGEIVTAVCTMVQANFQDAVSAVEDGRLFGQVQNEVDAALADNEEPTEGQITEARAVALKGLSADERTQIRRHSDAIKGPADKIAAELVKSAAQSAILSAAMKDMDVDTKSLLSGGGAAGQIKDVLADIDTAIKMGDRASLWREKMDEWVAEMNRLRI
jgi:hypothetical protein